MKARAERCGLGDGRARERGRGTGQWRKIRMKDGEKGRENKMETGRDEKKGKGVKKTKDRGWWVFLLLLLLPWKIAFDSVLG